jgi:transposase
MARGVRAGALLGLHCPPELKAEAVRLLRAGDRSLCQVAKDLDRSETSLRGRASDVDVDVGKGNPEALTTAERAELANLRKHVKRLDMEREILKRASAFFAKESE